ncbi:MAG: antibiotic ABC transporter ATP-binding protein [Crocinitomicaceae bacterium]|nr:antibiotic ABC transporter ATP-binding protein [Crocinitomicaceae bacterium]
MKRLKVLLPLLKSYRWNLLANALLNALGAVLSLFTFLSVVPFLRILFGGASNESSVVNDLPGMIGEMFDLFVKDVGEFNALTVICCSVVVLAILKNLTTYLAMYSLATIRTGVSRDLRNNTYKKILGKQMNWFTDSRKGDLMSRLTVDLHEVEVSVVGSIEVMFKSPLMIFISFGVLLALSWELTLFAMLFLPVSGLVISRVAKKLKKSALRGKEELGSLSNILEETLSGMKIIKAFGSRKEFEKRYRVRNQEHFKAMRKMFQRQFMSSPLSEVISLAVMALLLGYGGQIVLAGDTGLTGDWFIGYLVVFSQIIPPARALSDGWFKVSKGVASLDRIEEMFEDDKGSKILKDGVEGITGIEKYIILKQVSYSYSDSLVLDVVDLEINKGEVVALVGASGSGKTTLSNLLVRFDDPTSGVIEIDGVDLASIKVDEWRSILGVVTQDAILFNDSIASNIALSDPNPDMTRLLESSKAAHVLEFAEEMPDGLDTMVGDGGGKLSGGQRQRVALARALYRDPSLLILDEATSALDAASEHAVQEALDAAMKGRTVLVIAHRLSTVRKADKIVLLDAGKVVESGSHDELMAKGGAYSKLVELQSFG